MPRRLKDHTQEVGPDVQMIINAANRLAQYGDLVEIEGIRPRKIIGVNLLGEPIYQQESTSPNIPSPPFTFRGSDGRRHRP